MVIRIIIIIVILVVMVMSNELLCRVSHIVLSNNTWHAHVRTHVYYIDTQNVLAPTQ